MERKASKDLINWYHAKKRKPLIVRGARQVGKTWLINDFAEKLGKPFVYTNFEDLPFGSVAFMLNTGSV